MNANRNRRGSVLLMAIGMLTILAILASTFLVVSNLDSEETEVLAVVAGTDPLVDGLIAKAVAEVSEDRFANDNGPYGNMSQDPQGWIRYIDCSPDPEADDYLEDADNWLAKSYVIGEGITAGQLTNLEGESKKDDFIIDQTFSEGSEDPDFIDTDGDETPDARLIDTGIACPTGDDSTTYWVAYRIVDLASRICVNTAAGWNSLEPEFDRPIGAGPVMVDLQSFLDNRGGASSYPIYPLLHSGDNSKGVRGRLGSAAPTTGGIDGMPPVAGSTRGYGTYCGNSLLAPLQPSSGSGKYSPFGIGDEAFFLNACDYMENTSQFGGRLNQIIVAATANAGSFTPLSDSVRRQLTTFSSVSARLRWPEAVVNPLDDFSEPMALENVQNINDCQLVYNRMKQMLQRTGVGTASSQSRMAAHFAANLWAYCDNGATNAPWKFAPTGESFTVYGLDQSLVITQVYARHKVNTEFDPNEPDKDNSAWGYAVEVANVTPGIVAAGEYELEVTPEGGTPVTTTVFSGLFFGAAGTAPYPQKKVVYTCGFGEGYPGGENKDDLFGTSGTAAWYEADNDALDFRAEKGSISITLYRKVKGERVPLDHVFVGANGRELNYDTSVKPEDISGDYDNKTAPTAQDAVASILRDDRLLVTGPVRRLARYNLAMYKAENATSGTKLGRNNGVTDPAQLTVRSYYGMAAGNRPAVAQPNYSPGIYRPRSTKVSAGGTAREAMPSSSYYLPSLGDLCNIYLTGPISDGTENRPFTTEIMREDLSNVFRNRADMGRMPSIKPMAPLEPTNFVDNPNYVMYPDIPPAYMFHEFFTRSPAHKARSTEEKRQYGMVNINTLAIPSSPGTECAGWWLPWPNEYSSTNRLGIGQKTQSFSRADALTYIRNYRDKQGDGEDRAAWIGIDTLRTADGSDIYGFLTPGEIGIPLAKYMDSLLAGNDESLMEDTDYIRARNALFGYVSDCITTRSDVFACYVTVQVGQEASDGRRWRYVAVIDRSNVMNADDKAAVIMLTQLR